MLRCASLLTHARFARAGRRAAILTGFAWLLIPTLGAAQIGPRLPDSPGGNALRLNAAIARLARDPRDVAALLDAGNAALATNDDEAAIGFFKRADQVSPHNPKALSGLARALLQNDDPVGAIAVFDDAGAAGANDAATTADRGLAHDLVGDNLRAQQLYRDALKQGSDPETQRRLALSLAITGDQNGAETTLHPLLQAQDRAGWRTRAFMFAIAGKVDEAITIAKTLLPPDLAAAITPYLRYMPQLTRAQQAAAANLGVFPRASDIGHDDPRIAQYLAGHSGATRVAAVDRQLTPVGEPLGRKTEREPRALSRSQRAAALAARTAPPDPVPVRQAEDALATTVPSPASAPTPTLARAPTPAPGQTFSPRVAATTQAPVPAATAPVQGSPPKARLVLPQFAYGPPDVASAAGPPARPAPLPATTRATLQPVVRASALPASAPASSTTAPSTPALSASQSAPAPRRVLSLADVFNDLGKPTFVAAPRPGTVDISRFASARPKQVPKPPPPSHPSRIWVQLATGRDWDALATDWRRFTRESGGVLRNHQPFISEWGARNRLLTGPFESEAAAHNFIQQLAKANVSGPFTWVSPAGQVVDSLDQH